jgi:hypothetical protein
MVRDNGSFGGLGDCGWADGIQSDLYMDEYVRIRTCMTIYGFVALLDRIQSSFSISTIPQRVYAQH